MRRFGWIKLGDQLLDLHKEKEKEKEEEEKQERKKRRRAGRCSTADSVMRIFINVVHRPGMIVNGIILKRGLEW
jgi:hypothetical protein